MGVRVAPDRPRFVKAAGALSLAWIALVAAGAGSARAAFSESPVRDISARCSGQNAEVEQAADPTGRYVYETWIGCHGIGFARSTDGGSRFSKPTRLRDSGPGSWDPAVTVGPEGTVYVAFMVMKRTKALPVVLASFDHGATFPQRTVLAPRRRNNWGDRDFIAAGPAGALYLTWDYGPFAGVKLECFDIGSCAIRGGDANVVLQISSDRGRAFGRMRHLTPGFPIGGADSAPLIIDPTGRIDVLYEAFSVINRRSLTFGRGHSYFISSGDGGRTWSAPVAVGRSAGSIAPTEWWINGDLASDAAGDLYATWDTQARGRDTGWLSYSTDQGVSWSRPLRVVQTVRGPNIVQVAGGTAGTAYVGWLSRQRRGYSTYLSAFSIAQGRLSAPHKVSRQRGRLRIWPGDTFGLSAVGPNQAMVSWGSATSSTQGKSEIFTARVTLP